MIRTGAEYGLYWLAINRPDIFEEALAFERLAMLAENRSAEQMIRRLLQEHNREG